MGREFITISSLVTLTTMVLLSSGCLGASGPKMHVETVDFNGAATIRIDNEGGKRDVILEESNWGAVDKEGGVFSAQAIEGPPAIAAGYSNKIIVKFPVSGANVLAEIRYTDPETMDITTVKIRYSGE